MTARSTKSVGQHTAISRAQANRADKLHEREIQDEDHRPLKQKYLRNIQRAIDAPMGWLWFKVAFRELFSENGYSLTASNPHTPKCTHDRELLDDPAF